jgi:preprotein translocase subunit SecA
LALPIQGRVSVYVQRVKRNKVMIGGLARRIFGTANERMLKQMSKNVEDINAKEKETAALSDTALKAKTGIFKERLAKGENIDNLLVEAFAVVREAAKRVHGTRHYDVQLLGGIILHRGMIAEMKTGEGKTLTATLPVYLNALEGKGAHVVTVNDYLAHRDAEWMGAIYQFLGLSVGCIVHDLSDDERRAAYAADITYGTNNEYGFDYLRDNMKFSKEEMVQRGCHFAIVDEVDSILIDEARTPLIISGPTEDNSSLYYVVDKLVRKLGKKDYEIDEKSKSITLTEEGNNTMEAILKKEKLIEENSTLYDLTSISLVHHVNQALRAQMMFTKDKDYIVKDSRVIIIDEFTGRMMEGRRYSEGLHQALEAKEDVPVQNENQTLASITFQNYFRLYRKLAGMTGTAMTEAAEFSDIYKLEVVAIPSNRPTGRKDREDDIFRTEKEKFDAIIKDIVHCYKRKQPVLVGTISIEKSEEVANVLKKHKIPHNVLNAKQHEREAYIVAQAGRSGAVTIATNMAGRGTDIMLGGNPEMLIAEELQKLTDPSQKDKVTRKILDQVKRDKQLVIDAGGLYVLGTERHESRRIDNQLRGRSGRQGDPGLSKFFLSLEDDLMRIFGSERISNMLQKLGLKEGEAITHPWISRSIEKAQQKVEQMHFDIRKNLLKFDDVMNDQRKVIYSQRIELMESEDVSETIKGMVDKVSEDLVTTCIPLGTYAEEWDIDRLGKEIFHIYGLHVPVKDWVKEEGVGEKEILAKIDEQVDALFAKKEKKYGSQIMRLAEKRVLLLTLDQLWKDHLLSLDHLKQGIGLRAYGQKDPLNEYKREAFDLFEVMLNTLRQMVTQRMAHMELGSEENVSAAAMREISRQKMIETREDPAEAAARRRRPPELVPVMKRVATEERNPSDMASWGRVARNEACPCGSGKKYKQCHGILG